MSHSGENFEILNQLTPYELKNIEMLHIFFDKNQNDQKDADKNILYLTKQREFKSFGSNTQGQLGLGHRNQVDKPTLVEELCDQKIINISHGLRHVVALTKTATPHVYCWGRNSFGQLGKGDRDNNSHKPTIIDFFESKFVEEISCGENHSLALTKNGDVYAWGLNKVGQIGCGNKKYQLVPIKVEGFQGRKIISISCGSSHSMALAKSGSVYCWGNNTNSQLGINLYKAGTDFICKPRIIKFGKNEIIKEICCGLLHSMVLSTRGNIYAFGCNENGQLGIGSRKSSLIPKKVEDLDYVFRIAASNSCDISVSASKNHMYFIWGKCGKNPITKPKETIFDCFSNIFAYYKQITHKPVFLDRLFEDGQFHIPTIERMEYTIQRNKYKKEFFEIKKMGEGSFGSVFKVNQKLENQLYAIKKIPLKSIHKDVREPNLNELRLLAQLQSEYIVQYIAGWIESNHLNNKEKNHILYIQMGLCPTTLEAIISFIHRATDKNEPRDRKDIIFYVTSELFIEILEGVNYLHKFEKPIIHRDLKPTNILISFGLKGRFVKIADLGLATIHIFDNQCHSEDKGTAKYMANEVITGGKYDTKADIYSLGVIAQELFNVHNIMYETKTFIPENKYETISNLCKRMLEGRSIDRPNCDEILKDFKSTPFCICDIKENLIKEEIIANVTRDSLTVENFIPHFLQKKLISSSECSSENHKHIVQILIDLLNIKIET